MLGGAVTGLFAPIRDSMSGSIVVSGSNWLPLNIGSLSASRTALFLLRPLRSGCDRTASRAAVRDKSVDACYML
jgi:hypothetical protein